MMRGKLTTGGVSRVSCVADVEFVRMGRASH